MVGFVRQIDIDAERREEIEAAVAAERDRCAKIAESVDSCGSYDYDNGCTEDGYRQAKVQIAKLIRNEE